jgi:transposase
MPPAYVKPYVKRNKSDAIDAAACWEAVGRPDMRFVPVKTVEQQGALSLHRSRDLLVSQRTQLGNALRALLSEFGIVAGTGKAGLGRLVDELRAGMRAGTLELPADAVVAATVLADQRAALDAAADVLERRITAQAKADRKAVMLKTAPGVGPLTAHATLATMPDPSLFKSGRHFAAWLGLAPRISGTGGKTHTGSITKQGNQPLRRLLVLGATAWLRQVRANPEKGSPWLRGLLARRPAKVVAVAQAARTARILWAMLTHNQPYRAPAIG